MPQFGTCQALFNMTIFQQGLGVGLELDATNT